MTCPAAKIRINRCYRRVSQILKLLDLDIPMCFVYVDDFRVGMEPIPYGYQWSHVNNKWSYSSQLAQQELEKNITPEQKTKDTLLQVMNGINKDLTFTAESQSDFADNHLPTLDCKLSLVSKPDGNISHISYTYNEIAMNTKCVTIKTSVMCQQEKL